MAHFTKQDGVSIPLPLHADGGRVHDNNGNFLFMINSDAYSVTQDYEIAELFVKTINDSYTD